MLYPFFKQLLLRGGGGGATTFHGAHLLKLCVIIQGVSTASQHQVYGYWMRYIPDIRLTVSIGEDGWYLLRTAIMIIFRAT